MDYTEFIKSHLKSCITGSDELCNEIVEDVMDKYKKSNYVDLCELLTDGEKRIKQYSCLSNEVTATQFAIATGVCLSSARKSLKSISGVTCNKKTSLIGLV